MTEKTMYTPELTADGSWTMRNHEINECFHSTMGAEQEAQTLYLEPTIRYLAGDKDGYALLDVGLGLGYNALAFVHWWHTQQTAMQKSITLISLEKDLGLIESLTSKTGQWQENWSEEWLAYLGAFQGTGGNHKAKYTRKGATLEWTILGGDATTVELSPHKFDVVWQDAFSPKKNPDLWSTDWFTKLKANAAPGTLLLTYSVAGTVKQALTSAGWQYEKILRKDSEHKKQWLKATAL